jgi:RND family efflux transporter MFP subunit
MMTLPPPPFRLALCALLAAALSDLAAAPAPAPAADPAGGFDCLIEASQMLDIRSPVTGLIERVHAARGTVVRRGQPLVTLESTVERAAAEMSRARATLDGPIQEAQARLSFAELKARRKGSMAEEKFIAAGERDEAEAERAIAQAALNTAREARRMAQLESAYVAAQLAQRVIKSPIDGVVVEQNMHAGELADASEAKAAILKIAQTNPLRVRLILPIAYYPRVKPGMAVEIVPEAPIGGRQRATVSSIDRVVDAASGTFQVRIDLPNPNGLLPGGTRCRAVLPGL